MFKYNYIGDGAKVGDHIHRAFEVYNRDDGELVANGLKVTSPDGSVSIRIFDYDEELESQLYQHFKRVGVKEVTFTGPK